jgi:mono/diheme cytochrome c family protein
MTAVGLCFAVLIDAAEQKVPDPYRKMKNPLKPTKEVLAAARQLYKEQCAMCHGAEGKGDGAETKVRRLRPPPANFTTESFAKNSDPYIFWRLSEGVAQTEMTAYKKTIPEKDRWGLVLLIRSFNPKMAKGKK